ncbi:MAG TPA: hypothetical protein VK157_03865 [Phycisphaerales bacterium]|nr:hypothetical protein [Phycisphaerales bacterium]
MKLRFITSSVLALGLLCMAGCNIVAPAYVLIHGPEKTPAVYKLDEKKPTVILVDDRASVLPRRSLRTTIAGRASQELLNEKAVETVIDAKAIQALLMRDPADRPSPIAALGRQVQAQQVIYVTMDKFALSPDGATYQPFADARVKVIDVEGGRTWPEQPEGYALRVVLPIQRDDLPNGAGVIAKAQEALADRVGVELSRLFFKYETNSRPMETR